MPIVITPVPPEQPLPEPGTILPGQWKLAYPGTDLLFGDHTRYPVVEPPDLGSSEAEVQDASVPAGDGVLFGRDYRQGRTIVLEIGVTTDDPDDNHDELGWLAEAWRGDAIRTTPGAVAELHSCVAGRQRLVYGRPRRFSPIVTEPNSGYSQMTAEFVTVDDLWYSAKETTLRVPLVPPPAGGLEAPLEAPLSTVMVVNRPGLVTTGGNAHTWPVITIQGPISQPTVRLTGQWSIALDTTLAWDQSVTIDTRPWARTVLRNDGANLAGRMTRTSSRLADARIPPRTTTEVVFGGMDETGTASVTVSWREAYTHF